jgi:hypothetical protein
VDGVDDPSGGVFDGAPDYWARPFDDDAAMGSYDFVGDDAGDQIDLRK